LIGKKQWESELGDSEVGMHGMWRMGGKGKARGPGYKVDHEKKSHDIITWV